MKDNEHLGGVEGWDEQKILAEMHGDAFIGDFVGEDFVGDAHYDFIKQQMKANRLSADDAEAAWQARQGGSPAVAPSAAPGSSASYRRKIARQRAMAEQATPGQAPAPGQQPVAQTADGGFSFDPRATVLDPRFWFRSRHTRLAARANILANKKLAKSLEAQAEEASAANDQQKAAQLMEQARAVDAQARADAARFDAAENAAAISGYFGSDEDRMAVGQAKEWESKVAADLATKTRGKSRSGSYSEREAAVLNMEADAHEAQSRLLGAEAKAICGEAVSSIMGDDDSLGTWDVVGRMTRATASSPGAKFALKAAGATPLGMQVRAGRKVAKMAQKDPTVRAKVKQIAAKAEAGHPGAKKKLGMIKAGKKADDHKKTAQAVEIKALRKDAAGKRRKAARSRFSLVKFGAPTIFGRKSARKQRAKKLNVAVATVRATKSKNPIKRGRAKKQVAFVVNAAQAGNPKAQQLQKQLQLANAIDKHTQRPADKKRMQESIVLIREAKKGDPLAKQKLEMVKAAAEGGNPGAQRSVETLAVAAAAENYVSGKPTGMPSATPPGDRGAQIARPGMPSTSVPPIPGSGTIATRTAAAAAAMGVPAAAAAGAVMKAKAGDPTARAQIDAANRLHEAASRGDPRARAQVAAVAKGAKAGNPKATSIAVAMAAAVGIKKSKGAPPPSATLRPHVPTTPSLSLATPPARGGFLSALVQIGPVPNSPFRRYYSGINKRQPAT
jgi:hypothetical protein